MAEISRFHGIVIKMHFRDHPPPHFHARCGSQGISVDTGTGTIEGKFPPRALRLVREWYHLHRRELEEDWMHAEMKRPLRPILPLE